jgi:uncharacterized protein (DUF2062 family)
MIARPDGIAAPCGLLERKARMPRFRKARVLLRRWLRNMVRLHGSPKQIALGFAVGMFIGWMPIGLQMIAAIVVATMIGANRVAAALATWFTNPLTSFPLAVLALRLGRWVLRGLGIVAPATDEATIAQKLAEFWDLSWRGKLHWVAKGYVEWWVGALILGLITGVVSYYIVLKIVEAERRLVARRRAKRLAQEQASSGKDNPPSAP